ncbi:MAG: RIP metalloprotease RseP [Flavobacteriales bacterium]|nr:RIP metalloprotease RseP [Flavobacteriales bacterium]MBK7554616.1 RIP metalloprotease RseP [Flavobacteriales bacterium]MBK9196291.1 RIP metalloprotease RseP [Flavobacteriales bacterium]MBP6574804.1 RIP metalloprotease RseP [Flavobacteriales bacterium]
MIQAAQLLLSLSILIVLHEMGHFLPARWFKIRVEKFYLFFDPWFSLWKKKKGDTEYGIGWLPLGGYVKISGMVDESMDKAQMAKPPEPWEFRSKPAWQRLIVMIGGVTVNLLLGIAIYIGVLFVWGLDYLPIENSPYGLVPSKTMQEFGVQPGDRLLTVDGVKPESLQQAAKQILINDAKKLELDRNGSKVLVVLPEDIEERSLGVEEKVLLSERIPFYVGGFTDQSNGEKAGLQVGDRIVAVDSVPTPMFDQFTGYLKDKKNVQVQVHVERAGQPVALPVQVNDEGFIGVKTMASYDSLVARGHAYHIETKKYGFLESFPAGISFGLEKLNDYVSSLKLLFTKSGAKQVGGFGSMGSMFPDEWDWQSFWMLTAFISIILAFMNILPIPALDGGHVVFLLYEMVARKPAPQRVMEVAQMVGMVLLLGLLLFANGNDVIKGLTGKF